MDPATIAATAAAIISAIAFFKNIRDKRFDRIEERFNSIDERFNKVDEKFDKIDGRFKEVHHEIQTVRETLTNEIKQVSHEVYEVKERLAFIEACTLLVDVTSETNSRSEAARKAWARRRGRQIERKMNNE